VNENRSKNIKKNTEKIMKVKNSVLVKRKIYFVTEQGIHLGLCGIDVKKVNSYDIKVIFQI
jgi:hypothetical protein